MKFSRRDNGEVDIDLGEGGETLASFIWADVSGRPESVDSWIASIEEQRHAPEGERRPLIGNGYETNVEGDSTTIENQFIDDDRATYPTEIVLTALREYRDWLTSEAPASS